MFIISIIYLKTCRCEKRSDEAIYFSSLLGRDYCVALLLAMTYNRLMTFAFIADEITTFIKDHDSTWALMKAAKAKGHKVFYAHPSSLAYKNNQVIAQFISLDNEFFDFQEDNHAKLVKFPVVPLDENPNPSKYPCQEINLDEFKVIFMRKDPPVDSKYIYETQLLGLCKKALVVNNPSCLLINNEKLSILNFPDLIAETIVSESKAEIKAFINKVGKAVLKPLDGMGGAGIFVIEPKDKNLNSIIETSLSKGQALMIQKYIPEITKGDKRLIVINGECIGSVARIPSAEDNRGNLAAGGSFEAYKPSSRDLEIVSGIKDFLIENKIFFAGVDVIGDYLTEINITSPTCLQEINRIEKLSFENSMEVKIINALLAMV
jgi:glutathione synthase